MARKGREIPAIRCESSPNCAFVAENVLSGFICCYLFRPSLIRKHVVNGGYEVYSASRFIETLALHRRRQSPPPISRVNAMKTAVALIINTILLCVASPAFAGDAGQNDACVGSSVTGSTCKKGLSCVYKKDNAFVINDSPVCVGRGEQNDYCNPKDAGTGSKSCGGSPVCRKSTATGDYRCIGRGEQNDFCNVDDAGHGSKSCGGDMVCRHVGGGDYRCIGRGQQNDFCFKDDAGHGSKSCGGNLVCRSTIGGGGNWRCVGRGENGDFCPEDDVHHSSKHCGGKLVCRHGDGGYRCKKK